jgi:hypothetical protein
MILNFINFEALSIHSPAVKAFWPEWYHKCILFPEGTFPKKQSSNTEYQTTVGPFSGIGSTHTKHTWN